MTPPQPHDRSYRSFYSYPEIVEGTIRGFTNSTWSEGIDFSTLRQLPEVFISEGLAKREADTIWQAQCQDRPVLLYFAFEFQAKPLWFMAARVMAIEGLLYLRLIDKGILPPGKLPLIVPIVVYNGIGSWAAALDTGELIEQHPGLEAVHPRVSYLLLDLHRLPGEKLSAVDHPVSVLFELEQSDSPEAVVRGIDRLTAMLGAEDPLRKVFLSWLRYVLVPLRVPGMEIPEIERLEEFKTMLEENAPTWTAKWLAEGERIGERRGERRGEAKVLKRLAQRKFGVLSDEVRTRIEAASPEQLLDWAERLIMAERLDEVFAPAR